MLARFKSFETVKWHHKGKFEKDEIDLSVDDDADYIIVKFKRLCDMQHQDGLRFYAKKINVNEIIFDFDTLRTRDFTNSNIIPPSDYEKDMIITNQYVISNGYDLDSAHGKSIKYKDLVKKVNVKFME